MTDREIGYAEALAELEGILDELDGDEVDVDVLGSRVRRAAELLRLCRDRIASARGRDGCARPRSRRDRRRRRLRRGRRPEPREPEVGAGSGLVILAILTVTW